VRQAWQEYSSVRSEQMLQSAIQLTVWHLCHR